MTSASHLAKEGRKMEYVTRKMAPLRLKLDWKFNTNIFKTMLLPNIRLLGTIYKISNDNEKRKI